MPRNRQRTSTQQSWTEEAMTITIRAVNEKRMGYHKASKEYGVPKTTLIRRVQGDNINATGSKKGLGSNAISGFKKCGIVPYNPDVFGEADFAPSDVTDIPIDPVPTNTESYSVNARSPVELLPMQKTAHTRQKRKSKRGATAILTSSPYKKQLAATNRSQSTVSGNSSETSSSKKRSMKKAKVSRSSMQQKDTVDESDNNVDAECFYCNEMYSKSSENDGRIRVLQMHAMCA
ncbi:unnamed protein product [Clavelina lepadiformis]|uniref:HTH psq-type domain-containing protein n=1 Tax=Clavelina lepadiformis TaxID=159417 RepID=A0ABP0GVB6_CLALP